METREGSDLTLRLYTERFAPNHVVTLETDVDGDGYRIFGSYRSGVSSTATDPRGHWLFELDHYATGADDPIRVRFVVDDRHPMRGDALALRPSGAHEFDDAAFDFGDVPDRFRHGHDNLQVFETPVQQQRFRADHREGQTYDVIVIGSGMSGGILADELSDRGARVLVLEAGSLLFPTHVYNLPGSWEPLKERYFVYHHELLPGSTFSGGVKINLGGGSLFWSGIMQKARAWEFGSAWPDTVREFLLHGGGYSRAAELMREQLDRGQYETDLIGAMSSGFPEYEVERLPRARHQPHLTELPDGRIIQQNLLRESSGMFSTVDLLLDSMSYPGSAGSENLTVNLNHMVTGLETKGGRVETVVCHDLLANRTRRFRGEIVVLAAGSLGSTRIALESELHDPNGLVGRGLTDHPNFFRRFDWHPGEAPIGADDHAKVMLRHTAADADSHAYNVELMVNYQYWDRRVADEDVWRHLIVQPMDRIGVDVQFFFTSPLDDGNLVELDRAKRKLRISTARNEAGRGYTDTARDVPGRLVDLIAGGVRPRETSDLRYYDGVQIGHAAGTLRMATADSGVVDETQRWLSYDNLYVADLSVFPSVLAAKPSLTLAALSLRLADTILERLPGVTGPMATGIRGRRARARDRSQAS